MRITVLGKSPSWQDAGGACSGYLVEDADTCLLIDCGCGVLAQLRRVRDYLEVDAIVVSHMHADHFFDLIPFANALCNTPREQHADRARPQLLVPPGGSEVLGVVTAAGGQSRLCEDAFALREYDLGETVAVGSLRARFQPVPHYIATNAIDVTSSHGGRFTFGADHGPTDALQDFAAQTDLLILEATLPAAEPEPRGHLTAAEAGEHATACDAARLVLTHISDELDHERARAEAQRTYAGPVEVACTGAVYTV